ncbi:CynX/NimT family MFS transporter [Streptomyces olivoreticuli]|uniref:CynX/NimT family MFS transporter n=1 Tax=Streptomyces olivoreticuli TaxID=68246 RepID=UPI000E27212C|nr:MFS transporter [Streptomyces olivoreticuli]
MAHTADEDLTTGDKAASAPATDTPAPAPGRGSARRRSLLLAVGLVLAALNLRPAITSLGALMKEVKAGFGMSGALAGLLTSVPTLCFAVFGLAAPRLARRWGPAPVVCAGMAAIAAGLALRPFGGGIPAFLALSALALAGIAVSNVLMPVVVKRWFPDRVGPMTGLYSMALSGGAGVAGAVTVPLTHAMGGGWKYGLAIWAVLAAAAALAWLAISARGRAEGDAAPAAGAVRETTGKSITRSATAWALAVFFGLQSTGAYIVMGWLPVIFRDAGVSASTAGLLAATTMVVGVPIAFLLPRLASRLPHQGVLAVTLAAFGIAGYTGLLLAPKDGAWVWVVLLGVSNSAFPLALTMIGMRARTGAGMVRLSAFAQSVGYLISIPGPLLVGWLNESTGGWNWPIALMASLMVPQIVAGVLAGRDRTVEDEI